MKNPLKLLASIFPSLHHSTTPPLQPSAYLGPRFEPPNISASATVSDIQSAIRQAENGDTTSLFRFYRDSLLADDHIQGELSKRKLAAISQPLNILPFTKDDPIDATAATACLQAVEDCENWQSALSSLLNSTQYPVSIAENIYSPVSASPRLLVSPSSSALQYTLRRLEPVNPQLFCFRHAYILGGGLGTSTPVQSLPPIENQNSKIENPFEPFLRLWPTDPDGRILYDTSRSVPLDPSRHIIHRGHLLTDQRDNWGGPMRAILFWWLLRGLGRDWFARFMERYGSPFPIGKTNTQDPESVALLQTAFSLSSKIGGLIISQDDAVELKEATVQGGAQGHALWHQTCNNAISFHITGIKPSDKPAGLNAGESSLATNVREDVRIFDQKTLAETLVKQLFRNFLNFNGLQGKIRIVWGGLSDEDASTYATFLKTLSDAGFEPTDESLPNLQEKLGLEVQRKATPEPPDLSLGARPSLLSLLSAQSKFENQNSKIPPDPSDQITAAKKEALTRAYRGSMSPFREIILASTSREQCLIDLARAYKDWSPQRLATQLEEALQLAAAAGADLKSDQS